MNPTHKNKRKLRFAVGSHVLTRRRIKGVLKSGGGWRRSRRCTRRK